MSSTAPAEPLSTDANDATQPGTLYAFTSYNLHHDRDTVVEMEHCTETRGETAVYLQKLPSANQTVDNDQSRVRSEEVKEWQLHLKIMSAADYGLVSQLVEDAFAVVVHKWSFWHSVLNSNSDDILRLRKAAREALRNVNVRILRSKDESQAIDRVALRKDMNVSLQGIPNTLSAQNLLSIFARDATKGSTSYVCTSALDPALLLSVIVLRNGDISRMETDYLEVLGALDGVSHPTQHSLLDCFPKPLPENRFARFWPEMSSPDSQSPEPSTTPRRYNCFRKQAVRPLGHRCLSFGKLWSEENKGGFLWRRQNGFVAVFLGQPKYGSKYGWMYAWNTAVYVIVLGQDPIKSQPSLSESHRISSATTSKLEAQKKREAELELGDVIISLYPILGYVARGVYRVGRFVFFVEHGRKNWLSELIRLRPSLVQRLSRLIDSNLYLSFVSLTNSLGIDITDFIMSRALLRSTVPELRALGGVMQATQTGNTGTSTPHRSFVYLKSFSVFLTWLRRIPKRFAARLHFAPGMKWHVLDILPHKGIQEICNGQFKEEEAYPYLDSTDTGNLDTSSEDERPVESLEELKSRILQEMQQTERIGYAQFRMRQVKYDVEGGRVNLHPMQKFFWRAYVVGTVMFSVIVGTLNFAGRENWYERLFDCLQTLTFLWVGLFGLVKLSSEDPNAIRHKVFGYKIIRDVNDLRNDLGKSVNIDEFKLALINNTQRTMDWLSSEDLCFASPRCTGNVRVPGGLMASETAKEGLLVSENVAIYFKIGKAFRVSKGHIDKSAELSGEELSKAMPLSMRIKQDFIVAGPSVGGMPVPLWSENV